MTKVISLLRRHGWQVVGVVEDRVEIAIEPIEISRASGRLRRLLETHGVMLHSVDQPYDLPRAWVEYDLASFRCRMYLVLDESFLS